MVHHRRSTTLAWLLAGSLVTALGTTTSEAQQQPIAIWDGKLRTSTELPIISAQLRAGLQLQQTAVQQLSAGGSSESLEAAAKSIYDAYLHVRQAHAGILARISKTQSSRFQDPILPWQEQRIQGARSALLAAMDQAKNANRFKDPRRIPTGLHHLRTSITLVEQVLDVMP